MGTLPTQIAFDTHGGLPTAGGLVVPSPGQLRLKVSKVLPCDLIAQQQQQQQQQCNCSWLLTAYLQQYSSTVLIVVTGRSN